MVVGNPKQGRRNRHKEASHQVQVGEIQHGRVGTLGVTSGTFSDSS